MRSEQWIRTQKRRVRKKYLKAGNMYFSPKEIRKIKNGMFLKSLIKAIKNINKGFQELTALISEAVKAFPEAYTEYIEFITENGYKADCDKDDWRAEVARRKLGLVEDQEEDEETEDE